LELWRSTIPAQGTLADKYLRARGITIAIPLSIRFLPHVDYMPRVSLPAMVAAVQAPDRKIIAAQITFLDPRGERKAQVAMPRKTIGKLGHGAVRLGPSGDTLGLAEGVETTLSAMQIFGVPAWATLGAGRAQNVTVPECVRNLRVFADNDATGRDAANKLLI
jgi:putative DNA primase/helicase